MDTHSQGKTGGFTLMELLIVISIIAIVAAVAVPNLLSAKISANESAAISLLRNLASVQVQIGNRQFIDVDTDGHGEFGFFGELSGGVPPRNNGANALLPPLLAGSFQQVNNGVITRQGYHFVIYLPGANGVGLLENAGNYGAVDTDLAETVWCAYAWPSDFTTSGRNAYFINQVGEILRTDNLTQGYDGPANIPAPDAVFLNAGSIAGIYNPGQAAVDGGVWTVLD